VSISGINTPEPEPAKEPEAEPTAPKEPDTPLTTGEPAPVVSAAPAAPNACQICKPNAPCDKHILEAIMARVAPPSKQKKYFKMLIFAQPGSGKTVLTGTAPKNLLMDTEDGLTSLNNHPDIVSPDLLTIPYVSFFQVENLVRLMSDNVPEFADRECFSIDTMSELHKKGLAETVERDWRRNPVAVNRYVAQTEHHTENNEHIRQLMASMRDLNRHLIVTTHARTLEPKNRPALTIPDFSEKLANVLNGMMDLVGYLYKKEVDGKVHRVLRVHTDGFIACKTRIGNMPDEILDPTWPMLYEYFEKHNASAVG